MHYRHSREGFPADELKLACVWLCNAVTLPCWRRRWTELSHGAGGDAGPHAGSLHALNEVIYQESRAQAEAARSLIPAELLKGAATDMGSYVRVWVSHSLQRHQCPAYQAYPACL